MQEVEALLQHKNCPPFKLIFPANNDNWFVYFETYEQAQQAYNYLRNEAKVFKGRFIKARLKSRQSIFLPPSVPTPTAPSLPHAESLQSYASVAVTPSDVASSRDGQESVASAPGFEATLPPVASLSNELRVLSIESTPNQPIPAPPAVSVAQASVQQPQPQQLFAPQNYAMPALVATGQQQAVSYLTQANAGLPFAQQLSLVPMQQFFTRVPDSSALVCTVCCTVVIRS